jgi:hypothetical protein
MNVSESNKAAPVRNENRLMKCFRGNVRIPDGKNPAIGETKSAKGPTIIRDTVFAIDKSFTCNAAEELEADPRTSVERYGAAGRDSEIVPMFEMTISDYVADRKSIGAISDELKFLDVPRPR